MKNILINYKSWLFIIVLLSIWIILGVDLEYIPLIPSKLPVEVTSKINRVFLAISYSILAAYIFFFFTTVLPRIILIDRSKKILSKQVHWLLYELFVIINQILNSYEIKKSIDEVEEKDLLHINGNIINRYTGFYSTSEHWRSIGKKGKQFTGFGDMPFTFPDSMITNLVNIPTKINEIRQSNPNFHIDESFSEVLASIETNKLIEWYGINKYEVFRLANTSEELHTLISAYKRLKKLKYHLRFRNSFSRIHFYTKEEIESIEHKQAQFSAKIAPLRQKINSLNPNIIYNPEYSDSKAIVTVLRIRNLIAFDNKSGVFPQPQSKCVVIITNQISGNLIKKYVKENKTDKLIIKVKSSCFFSTKPKKYKGKETTNGIYTIYYKSPIKLFGLELFSGFPTKSILDGINRDIHEITSNYKVKE